MFQDTKRRESPTFEKDSIYVEERFKKVPSEEWIKQSIDQEGGIGGMREFLLALENTKLRR